MSRPPGRDARRSAASAAHEIVDPAEPWETPLPRAAAARLDPQAEAARPTRPSSEADLPPGVLRVLRFTCGSLPLERTLLFPPAVRPIDRSCRRFVTTPRQVLGLGERAAGLWVEWHMRDPAVVVPLERIGAIEDIRLLRYRRFSVRAADARLSVRYASGSRSAVGPPVAWLRRRIAGELRGEVPSPGLRSVGTGAVPAVWRAAAEAIMRQAGEGGAVALYGVAPPTGPDERPRGALVALTAEELIVLAESADACPTPDMPDLLAVPRRTLQLVRPMDDRLLVRSSGVERALRTGAELASAAAELVAEAGGVGPAARARR